MKNVIDGELVIDNKWRKGVQKDNPIFLAFDALLINYTNQMHFPFTRRLIDANTYMQNRFTKARILEKHTPSQDRIPPVDVYMKEMFNVWDAHVIFDLIKNKLEHENDGLIFTVDASPYYMGQCKHILKWKPLHLNTIDFNAIPLVRARVPIDDINFWSLHTRHGDLFDFICMSKAETEKYLAWMNENKTDSCVLECNFDREVDSAGVNLLNSLK